MKGISRIRKTVYRVRRLFNPGAVVLLYHRVTKLCTDPFSLAVSPDHFAQHLDYIQRDCRPMRLLDMVDAMHQRSLPNRAVAITFDDGYIDNFTQAYPLLEATQIPATIFVTSEQINSQREFWWDDLERVLLLPAQLPKRLRITIGGQAFDWPTDSKENRLHTHQCIHKLLRPIDAIVRDQIMGELVRWAGVELTGRPNYRAVTVEELIELSQSRYVDIGGHTTTHPVLATLPTDAQYLEIVGGRQRLESIIGKLVPIFAYPYGTPQDFTAETIEVVKSAGFQAACTTTPGSIEQGTDLFRLNRCPVFDWDLETFKHQLEKFFVD